MIFRNLLFIFGLFFILSLFFSGTEAANCKLPSHLVWPEARSCGGHGTCNEATQRCECEQGYTGEADWIDTSGLTCSTQKTSRIVIYALASFACFVCSIVALVQMIRFDIDWKPWHWTTSPIQHRVLLFIFILRFSFSIALGLSIITYTHRNIASVIFFIIGDAAILFVVMMKTLNTIIGGLSAKNVWKATQGIIAKATIALTINIVVLCLFITSLWISMLLIDDADSNNIINLLLWLAHAWASWSMAPFIVYFGRKLLLVIDELQDSKFDPKAFKKTLTSAVFGPLFAGVVFLIFATFPYLRNFGVIYAFGVIAILESIADTYLVLHIRNKTFGSTTAGDHSGSGTGKSPPTSKNEHKKSTQSQDESNVA